jgi:hypothetical protein
MKNDLFGIFQHTTTPLIYTQPLSKGTRMMMMIASPKQASLSLALSLSLSLSRTQANQKTKQSPRQQKNTRQLPPSVSVSLANTT